ncbi:unnamed protein product [Taenia asiatica]|uniref:Uncharacterized protein n=1 Tax=Taenia asiatica TaxID=60517 RepID=A0A0R3WFK5_TAEAS|nr:unnamed protein product [Taenia asiatica]
MTSTTLTTPSGELLRLLPFPLHANLEVHYEVDFLIPQEQSEGLEEKMAMTATSSRMGTSLRAGTPNYLTASSANNVVGARQVYVEAGDEFGGDGVAHNIAAHRLQTPHVNGRSAEQLDDSRVESIDGQLPTTHTLSSSKTAHYCASLSACLCLQVNFEVEDCLIGQEEGEGQREGPAMSATTAGAWARCCDSIAPTTTLPPGQTTWMVLGGPPWVISASPSRGEALPYPTHRVAALLVQTACQCTPGMREEEEEEEEEEKKKSSVVHHITGNDDP